MPAPKPVEPVALALQKAQESPMPISLGKMAAWLDKSAILNDGEYLVAADVLKYAKGHIKETDAELKKLTDPLKEVSAHLKANAEVVKAPAVALEAHIKKLIIDYQGVLREKAVKEAEKTARQVAKSSPQAAAEIRSLAATAPCAPAVAGLSSRTTKKARVTDLAALVAAVARGKAPSDCVEANQTFLNGLARLATGDSTIPGVVFETETTIASGSYSK